MDSAFNVLRVAVTGSILQYYIPVALSAQADAARPSMDASHAAATAELRGAFNAARPGGPTTAASNRAFWKHLGGGAVPPQWFRSNVGGAVKAAADRVQAFKIGPAYDIENVGLAPATGEVRLCPRDTGCEDKHSEIADADMNSEQPRLQMMKSARSSNILRHCSECACVHQAHCDSKD